MNATIPDGPAPATYSVFLDAETKTEAPATYSVFLDAETKTETETETVNTAPAVNAYRFPAGRPAEAVYYTEPTDPTAPVEATVSRGGSQQKHVIQREGVMYAVPSELAGGTVGSTTDQDGYEIPAAQKNNDRLSGTDAAGYVVPVGNPDAGIYAPVYNAPPGIKSVDLASTA